MNKANIVSRTSQRVIGSRTLALCGFLVLATISSLSMAALEGDHNKEPELCQGISGAAYTLNMLLSLGGPPPSDSIGEWLTYAANLNLKFCPPQIEAPASIYGVEPDADNQCVRTFQQPTTTAEYSNIMGIPNILTFPSDWGQLGTPKVYHFNTGVQVDLIGFDRITEAAGNFTYSSINGYVQLPVGRNQLAWRANTLVSYLDYVPLHLAKFPSGTQAQKEVVKHSSALQTLTQEGFKAFAKKYGKKAATAIVKKGVEYSVDKAFGLTVPHSAMGIFDDVDNTDIQSVWVYDRIPPVIETNTVNSSFDDTLAAVLNYDATNQTYILEAFQPGGVLSSSALPLAEGLLSYSDSCDTKLSLNHSNVPELWSVGDEVVVTWTVSDPGPIRAPTFDANGELLDDGGHNSAQVTQRFRVQDTNPPIVLAPPGKVVEVPSGTTQTEVSLGSPRVFDLVDLDSEVLPDRSDTLFDLGLSEITWTATDDAGNSSEAVQLINVKVAGTNSVPIAYSSTETATAFKPLDIILRGADADFHPSVNRYDPLTFSIVESPQNGFFIAPLLPFFIEDYRLEASALKFADIPMQADPRQFCIDLNGDHDPWELEYPYLPAWMTVDDEGVTYVIDKGRVRCNSGQLSSNENRMVAFGQDGSILRTRNMPNNYQDFHADSLSGRLYVLFRNGVAYEGNIQVYDKDADNFGVADGAQPRKLDLRDPGFGLQSPDAIVEDHQGIMYVQDSDGSIKAYQVDWSDPTATFNAPDTYLATLNGQYGGPNTKDMAVDSQNNLYLLDSHRIVKFSAGKFDKDGNFTPPQLLGWMGKCVGNETNTVACDIKQQRSIGFSCTDALCTRAVSSVSGNPDDSGDQAGQFYNPQAIAVDPNDILYVNDAGNDRVQRFTPEGYFAGQAKSQGEGYGFILGDFGQVDTLTVNSDHFYLLQRNDPLGGRSGLLHVFKTTPITPIDDSSAKVTYQSNNNYQGTDSFIFAATDGLDTGTATVSINVQRDYRAPTIPHPPEKQILVEGSNVVITLTASDADEHLDVLQYEIVEVPAYGSVEIVGNQLTYTPLENYAGEDSFTYRAYDGLYYSEPAKVDLSITDVPDAPVVTLEVAANAGTGFYIPLDVTVYDPDDGADHGITINWGDGSLENDGVILVGGVEVDSPTFNTDGTLPDNIETTGPIYSIGNNGYGNLNASHAYTQAGSYTIEVCASDKGTQTAAPQGCQQATVTVEPRVAYNLTAQTSLAEVNPGDSVSFTFTLENRAFDVTPTDITTGLSDSNVVISGTASPGLVGLSNPSGGTSCDINGSSYTCNLGAVPYDSSHVIQLEAAVDPLAPGQALLSINAKVSGTAPRHQDITGAGQVKVIAKAVPPQLVSLTPESGATDDGTPVTLTGNDFQAGAAVYFGNELGQAVEVIDAQTMTVMAPIQAAGVVDVIVINPDERSDKLVEAFTYRAPSAGGDDSGGNDSGGNANGGNSGGGGGGGATDMAFLLIMLIALCLPNYRRFNSSDYKANLL